MKTINNTIKITCETKDYLNIDELTEFQGELKARDDEHIRKMIDSIKNHGFSIPFFVWKHNKINHVLDGHGRLLALKTLDSRGFFIPPLPVVFVDCKSERDARDLLLRINSQYGKMTTESVLDFIGDFEIDVTNFELPSGTIKFDSDMPEIDFGDQDSDNDEKKGKLGVLVSCETEHEMEAVFMKLQKMGYSCKMVE